MCRLRTHLSIFFLLVGLIVVGSAGEPTGSLTGFGQPREWADKLGKFRMTASMTFASETEVQLKGSDGKRYRIQPPKLSEADQAYIKSFLAAESALKGESADNPFQVVQPNAPAASKSMDVEVAVGEPKSAEGVVPVKKFSDKRTADIAIDFGKAFWKAGVVSAIRIPVRNDAAIDVPIVDQGDYQILVAGATPMAFVDVFRDEGRGNGFSRLGLLDVVKGQPVPLGEFTVPWKILAVSPDATRLALVRIEGWGKGNDLVIATVAGGKMKADFQFRAGGGSFDELHWAGFVHNDRLATISQRHVLTIWDFKENRLSYRGPCGDALSAAIGGRGELLALPRQGRIALLSGSNLKQVGLIALNRYHKPSIAFSPDGQRLAAYTPYTLDLFRLQDGQLEKTITLAQDRAELPLTWIGDNVLLDSQLLIDCQRGIPLWNYSSQAKSRAAWAGQLFSLFPGDEGAIVATKLPHAEASSAAESIPADKLYALRKGSEIELTTNLNGLDPIQESAATQAVRRNLHDLGWKLVDRSRNQVHLELREGAEEESDYGSSNSPFWHPFAPVQGPVEKVRYRPWTHTITITIDGQQALKLQQIVTSPGSLTMLEGESIQQAVTRHVRPSVEYFRSVTLPAEILRPEYRSGLGTSQITADGLR